MLQTLFKDNREDSWNKTAPSWVIVTCWSADGTLLSQKAACDQSNFQGRTFRPPGRPSTTLLVWWAPVSRGGTPPREARSCWFLSRRMSAAHLYTWGGKQRETSRTDRVNGTRAFPDGTGRTPRPAPSEFRRISASVWRCLENHHPSGPEAPRWRRPSPAENACCF